MSNQFSITSITWARHMQKVKSEHVPIYISWNRFTFDISTVTVTRNAKSLQAGRHCLCLWASVCMAVGRCAVEALHIDWAGVLTRLDSHDRQIRFGSNYLKFSPCFAIHKFWKGRVALASSLQKGTMHFAGKRCKRVFAKNALIDVHK